MGRGGASRAGVAVAVAALAALAAGCGSSQHSNQPRPQVSTRVSVTIGKKELLVTPRRVAFGPEKHQQIPQNQNQAQPAIDTKAPLDIVFVIANQTGRVAQIEVRSGSTEETSEPIQPRSPESFQTSLPTGTYTVAATGVPGEPRDEIEIGPYRASSQNDVLLP